MGDSVLVQSKGKEAIDFNSIRIIIECSTIYTSSSKQMTKINELLPLHNVEEINQYLLESNSNGF
jgi:ssDNA-specific exonuclease RecJ